MLSTGEGLDHEHRGAAVSAHEGGPKDAGCGIGGRWRCRLLQKHANGGDLGLAVGIGEQSVVADAMEAGRQHVQQEAAHELVGHQCHRFVARAALGAVVLPAECNAAIIRGEEARVGDRHPMGVARQIGENLLRSCEGALGVDDPLALAKRCEPVRERIGVG